MGLLNCPDCNKINKASRNECWACSCNLIKRRNPDEDWAGGTYAYRRNPLGMVPIPKNVGTDLAKQLFFKNPKGETRMRSMRRYNRNPQNWGNYLNRQNPDLGESLFTTLYKRRKLQRRNPQPAIWSHQDIRSSGPATTGFKQPLFRRSRHNPEGQAPVWGAPSWGGGSAAWGRTLFRNPQAAIWSHQDIRSSGPATTGFKQPLFRNPDDLDVDYQDFDAHDEDRDDHPISDIVEDSWQENPHRSLFRNPDPEFDGMVDHEDTFENQVLDDDFDLNDHLDAPKRFRRN
jgi:hypothetical protein